LSVTSNFGMKPGSLSSLRINRSVDRLSRQLDQHVENLALVIRRHATLFDPVQPRQFDAVRAEQPT
jgi:hypothetical protein